MLDINICVKILRPIDSNLNPQHSPGDFDVPHPAGQTGGWVPSSRDEFDGVAFGNSRSQQKCSS